MREHTTQIQPPKGPVTTAARAAASPKSSAPGREQITKQVRETMIREAAYFRAEHRSFAPGNELEDWFDAEREIDAVLTGTKPESVRNR